MASRAHSGFFTVDPKFSPQIGQSFVLDRPITVERIRLYPVEISLAKKPEYL